MTDTTKPSACPQTQRAVSELEKAAKAPIPDREAYGLLAVFGSLLGCKEEAPTAGNLTPGSTPPQSTPSTAPQK